MPAYMWEHYYVLVVCHSLHKQQPLYTISIPIDGMQEVHAINNFGIVAGKSSVNAGAATWDYTRGVTELGMLGGIGVATDINDAGQVTGYSNVSGIGNHSFIWHSASTRRVHTKYSTMPLIIPKELSE